MKKIIVITGTPGTGKTTISEKVAKKLKNSELIKANDIVKKKRLFSSYAKDGSVIVEMAALKKELEKRIKQSDVDFVIVEGHLLCDIKLKDAIAIVVREHLPTLIGRYKDRGYNRKKMDDNIVAEAIDYCGVNASNNYKTVYELEGNSKSVDLIVKIVKGEKVKIEDIDMLGELNELLNKI